MAAVGLCEDDSDLRSVLLRALKAGRHDVTLGRNGREALENFPSSEAEVLVLDIGLPDSDGRDVAMALRAHRVKLDTVRGLGSTIETVRGVGYSWR